MSQRKPLVFISHIGAEAEIAIGFKKLIESHFLKMMDVFVSSDGQSITMGQHWLSQITLALESSAVEVIIASPVSVTRPWINFEAGAGWIRQVPVIPLCHAGMTPDSLPVPLKLLQASSATDAIGLRRVFSVLADALGAEDREPAVGPFIEEVKRFDEQYIFWDIVNRIFVHFQGAVIAKLQEGDGLPFEIHVSASNMQALAPFEPFLAEHGLVRFAKIGTMLGNEPMTRCTLTPLPNLNATLKDPRFSPRVH